MMGGIRYYQLTKDEELPDEFCVVKDIGGEPSEYTFYVPEAENAKLRECLQDLAEHIREEDGFGLDYGWMLDRIREEIGA